MNRISVVSLAVSLLVASELVLLVCAVSTNRYDKLKKEELVSLDREVTDYYNASYETLDDRNVTYDHQLFISIRSIRHTTVLNQFDFRYTDEERIRKSQGPNVNTELCKQQLRILNRMAKDSSQSGDLNSRNSVPISALNFLESSGRAEAGVLNGNFIWWGSHASCIRAKISGKSVQKYLSSESRQSDIRSRYCIVHLKAKSWPKWDIYFEDRISIRVGVCLPQSCHTGPYLESEEIRRDVDTLVRYNLLAPYNGDRYETTYLYCLPDEDSEFRQWDLGTKLFVAFAVFWLSLLLYTNKRYHERLRTMQKLRESVDIRMIINQKFDDQCDDSETEDNRRDEQQVAQVGARNTDSDCKQAPQSLLSPDTGNQAPMSASASPMASDIEENDGEFNVIRPIVTNSKKSRKRSSGQQTESSSGGGIDVIKAFSIKSNVDYLFRTRSSEHQAKRDESSGGSHQVGRKRGSSQQLSAVTRRTSSNEALIKDLQRDEEEAGGTKSKVAIVSGEERNSASARRKGRVNIDIFDGIKTIATCYIIYGHTLMFFFGLVSDLRFGDERMLDFIMVATINTLQVVSLFYIITGILLTYLAFSRQKLKQLMQPSFWVLVIVGRYIRLIPTYMLVFWFARHVAPYTGMGSAWYDYRTDIEHVRGYCSNQSWYTMLSMSAADVKIPFDCVPQAWYLSNDFRTLLILPVYIMILAMNRRAGYGAIFATFVFSWFRLVQILREANIDYMVILHWQPHVYAIMADRLHNVYTDLVVRLSTYLLGVMAGHLLYLYETNQIKRWPSWVERVGLKVALIVGASFFMGGPILANPYLNQFLPSIDDLDSDTVVVLIPLFKSAMELCISVSLLLLASGGGYNWVSDTLSSKAAKVLSNISYGVFLVHVEVMYKVPAVKFESSYWFLFLYSIFFIVLSNLVSFAIYLLYEMPINNVMRHIIRKTLNTFVR